MTDRGWERKPNDRCTSNHRAYFSRLGITKHVPSHHIVVLLLLLLSHFGSTERGNGIGSKADGQESKEKGKSKGIKRPWGRSRGNATDGKGMRSRRRMARALALVGDGGSKMGIRRQARAWTGRERADDEAGRDGRGASDGRSPLPLTAGRQEGNGESGRHELGGDPAANSWFGEGGRVEAEA